MSVIGEIRLSLEGLGAAQQALLFTFVSSYPLALGRLLDGRARRAAGVVAAAALLGVAATMQPWMHGVVIGFALVLGMGLFIAAACALDQAPRLVASVRRPGGRAEAPGAPVPLAELAGVAPDASRERAPGVPLPLPGRAGSL